MVRDFKKQGLYVLGEKNVYQNLEWWLLRLTGTGVHQ
jgi:hypothetical protein